MHSKKIFFTEIILTILLVLMFQYIMGEREEYSDTSREPDKNAERIVIDGVEPFIQYIFCEKDTLKGVMVLTEAISDVEAEISVQVFNEKGELLAAAVQPLAESGAYTQLWFSEIVSGCTGKKLKLIFQSATGHSITLADGSCEGVLGNENRNACVKLVYKVLNIGKYKITVYIVGGILWFILSGCLIMMFKKNRKHEYVFAFLYFSLGILYMAVNPLYGIPDEGAHFLRTYGISEGCFITKSLDGEIGTGSMLPENLLYGNKGGNMKLTDIMEGRNIKLSNEKIFWDYWNTALYSPFTYTAQVLGVIVGKFFSLKIFSIAYCGRFAAWLVAGGILFFAVRYLPFGKNILIAVSLLPMNMHESISLAGDTFTFAVSAAFISFILYLRYTKKTKIDKKEYLLFYILLFFIASCKIVYVPLCLFAVLIPVERFGDRRKYFLLVLLSLLYVILIAGIWLVISMQMLNGQSDGKSWEQVCYILSAPLSYIETIFNTTVTYGEGMVKTMLGSSLGWLSISVNMGVVAMVGVTLIYVCVCERGIWQGENSIWPRVCMIGAVICVIVVMYTSLYVQWTDLGKNIIDGIQGRYFLPILLPFILSLKCGEYKVNSDGAVEYNLCVPYLVLLITNIFTLITLLTNYII